MICPHLLGHLFNSKSYQNQLNPAKANIQYHQPTSICTHAFMNLFFNKCVLSASFCARYCAVLVIQPQTTMNRTNIFPASRSLYANEDKQTRKQEIQQGSILSAMTRKFRMLCGYTDGIL